MLRLTYADNVHPPWVNSGCSWPPILFSNPTRYRLSHAQEFSRPGELVSRARLILLGLFPAQFDLRKPDGNFGVRCYEVPHKTTVPSVQYVIKLVIIFIKNYVGITTLPKRQFYTGRCVPIRIFGQNIRANQI